MSIKKNTGSGDLVEKLVAVNKVSKTVKGGKNFSFAAFVVVGDKNGRVGSGKGNAREVTDAKNKAFEAAKKSGAQIITTDYYQKSSFFNSDYIVYFENGNKYLRVNTLLQPKDK